MVKELLGTKYFTPAVDPVTGDLKTKYEGTVIAFIVRKDDGEEFEVRKQNRMMKGQGLPLTLKDCESLTDGTQLAFLDETIPTVKVVRTWPLFGDIWIRGLDGKHQSVVKYFDLKKIA